MKEYPNMVYVASLIGDPARANMLAALLSGKALTATELAIESGVTLQTASSHLSKLDKGGLIKFHKSGRHKYFSLRNNQIAEILEGITSLASLVGDSRIRTGPKDSAMRYARVCYDHLAGHMGTQFYDFLVQKGYLLEGESVVRLSKKGEFFAQQWGIDLLMLQSKKTMLCRQCLDWSERRYHLSGSLGRAFYSRFIALGWCVPESNSRVVLFTAQGQNQFDALISGKGIA